MSQEDEKEREADFTNEFSMDETPMDLGLNRAICLPPEVVKAIFQVFIMILHLL